jgi:hypothetical protein
MHHIVPLSLVALVVIGAVPAQGQTGFRCSRGRILRKGETQSDVARKCGPADDVRTWSEARTETVHENGQAIERTVVTVYDEWTYNLGRNQLVRYVVFTDGRLAEVRTGEYGD